MSYMWSLQEEHLLKILLPTNSYPEISQEFDKRVQRGLPGFRCERSAESVRKKCDRENLSAEDCVSYKEENPYTERWDEINKISSLYRDQSIERGRGRPESVSRKILCISDIHLPLARSKLLQEIIEKHSDADILVINGDLFEGYIYSIFPKSKSISGLHEYLAAFELVSICQDIFDDVVLIDGNHDIRAAKALRQTGLSKEAIGVLRPNFMARLANGEELDETGLIVKRHDWKNVHYNHRESWYERIGKTIFAHPWNRGSSKPGFTAEKVFRYFAGRYDSDEFDSVVVAHTHKIFKGVIDSYLLMEQGCLADLFRYSHEPRLRFTTNALNGYAVIYQDDQGNTDFNLSEVVYLGEVLPPKKKVLS